MVSISLVDGFEISVEFSSVRIIYENNSEKISTRVRSVGRGVLGCIPTQQAKPRVLITFYSLQNYCLCIIVILCSPV